ncbi:MAG: elongation factor P [Candidatus Yanofskybacteria bacterium]|nr:elongation factor P [Candidatus Yanofskybacteria bacterium]
MLSYFDLRRGVRFIYEGQPYEVLEFRQMGKAQHVVVAQTKIRNLLTGNVFERNFHKAETFEEADIEKVPVKFIYERRGVYVFAEEENPSRRFEMDKEKIGEQVKFLKPNEIVEGLRFQGEIINVTLPIKVQLKVAEAPPGIKGDRSQGGTKTVVLETGASVNVPLFIEQDDLVEINTETGEYARRVQE